MSMELYVGLRSGATLEGKALISEARRLGFDVAAPELDLAAADGFQPVSFNGQDSGVEISWQTPKAYFEEDEHFTQALAACERMLTFRWGGDLTECALAFALGAAAEELTGAVVLDSEEGEIKTAAELAEIARSCLKAAEEENA